MGFTGRKADEWKIKYIEAFNKMEETIKKGYQLPRTPMETLSLMFDVQKEQENKILKIDERITNVEENGLLNPGEYTYISGKVHERIRIIRKEYDLLDITQKQIGALYRAINHDIKEVANVCTRSQIRKKDFEWVKELIRDWIPSKALLMNISQMSFDFEEKEGK